MPSDALPSNVLPSETQPKLAIVTGASRGLGRNTVLNLARRGVDVILTYHSNRAEADAAVAEIEALGRKAKAFQLDTGNVAAFDGFGAEVARALKEVWVATGSIIWSTMPASGSMHRSAKPRRRISTGSVMCISRACFS